MYLLQEYTVQAKHYHLLGVIDRKAEKGRKEIVRKRREKRGGRQKNVKEKEREKEKRKENWSIRN